ncbi:MAG TPA: glycoside hydrolase family 99-like domain-containing protein [Candidatus Omnitrophota bacterium]|nr:glycoside hydrolase family 99-like domain-containing protein [Candidatus Omnitrophota bacterium]
MSPIFNKKRSTKESLKKNVRLIAFYLPQFHPIPENDEWWGKGFTEWTNTAKAKPMFRGHYQPHVPADLGFYDLRLPEVRIAQAEMAKEYGIEGFCYWHYWFGNGRRLLERPFNEVLKFGEPDFPFCLGWANESWSGKWHGAPDRILIEQTYPGLSDYEAHFKALEGAFFDQRYITVDGRPLFLVYQVNNLPNPKEFADCWRNLAARSGLKGIYLVAHTETEWNPLKNGFDATVTNILPAVYHDLAKSTETFSDKLFSFLMGGDFRDFYRRRIARKPDNYLYENFVNVGTVDFREGVMEFPMVLPNWDNTPRSGMRGLVLHNSTPELFRRHLRAAINQVSVRKYDERIIIIKSWNEWAEGNHLEPDLKFGKAYLEVIKSENVIEETEL